MKIIKEQSVKDKGIPLNVLAWTTKEGDIAIRENFYFLLNEKELRAVTKHEELHLKLNHKPSWDNILKRHIVEIFEKNEREVEEKLSQEDKIHIKNAHEKYAEKYLKDKED